MLGRRGRRSFVFFGGEGGGEEDSCVDERSFRALKAKGLRVSCLGVHVVCRFRVQGLAPVMCLPVEPTARVLTCFHACFALLFVILTNMLVYYGNSQYAQGN